MEVNRLLECSRIKRKAKPVLRDLFLPQLLNQHKENTIKHRGQ